MRLIREHEPIIGWRQIRHGKNHRRPSTHAEERAERDEATRPTQEQIDQDQIQEFYGLEERLYAAKPEEK